VESGALKNFFLGSESKAIGRHRRVKAILELSNKNSAPSGGFQSHDLTVMNVYREL